MIKGEIYSSPFSKYSNWFEVIGAVLHSKMTHR